MIYTGQGELRVLAAALASRRARLAGLAALTPADFLDATHREVWSIIAELTRSGEPVTLERVKEVVLGRGLAWLDDLERAALALVDPAPLITLVKRYASARAWYRLAKDEIKRRVPGVPAEVEAVVDQMMERVLTDPAALGASAKIRELIDETVSVAVAAAAVKTARSQGATTAAAQATEELAPVEEAAKEPSGPASSEATWNRKWDYSQPVWYGRIGDFEFSREAPQVLISTARSQPAARAVINLTNFKRELEGKIAVGDPVLWQWGYADRPGELITIFDGFVSNVIEATEMAVEAHDQMTRVWQARRTQAFNDASAAEILGWFLDAAGVPGNLAPGGRLTHFPADSLDASAVAARLVDSLTRRDGVDRTDWAWFIDRSGLFVWGPYETHSHQRLAVPPEFRLAHNVVHYRPARRPGRLSRIKTLAVPEVRHSMDIKIRGRVHRTERVTYHQRPGSLRMEIAYR